MRVLALDYGSARCGCAVSDPTGVLATPLDPVLAPASRRGLGRLCALVAELGAERVVVGLPLTLAGGDSAQTREAREFAQTLQRRLGDIPVELFDERFTTRLAQLDGGSGSGSGGGGARLRWSEDSRAAAHLLTGWLDARAEATRG